MHTAVILAASIALCSGAPQPQKNEGSTRFFTGNQALDNAIAGAAIGAGSQFLGSQILNPCNTRNRGSSNNNNRILGNDALGNGIFGAALGFAASAIAQNSGLINPCG